MHKKTFAVIGLGRYGIAVAKELIANGMEVIAIDSSEKIVNDAVGHLPVCKCADITDAEAFSQLGISNVDVVIVSMASNLEASVMAVTLCKEAGVNTVIAKCANEMHQMILKRVGADQVVFPEYESGTRLAKTLLRAGYIDMISLSKEISMIELDVMDDWVGRSLLELNLRKKYGINVVAYCENEKVHVGISPELPLTKEMKLIVIGKTAKVSKLFH